MGFARAMPHTSPTPLPANNVRSPGRKTMSVVHVLVAILLLVTSAIIAVAWLGTNADCCTAHLKGGTPIHVTAKEIESRDELWVQVQLPDDYVWGPRKPANKDAWLSNMSPEDAKPKVGDTIEALAHPRDFKFSRKEDAIAARPSNACGAFGAPYGDSISKVQLPRKADRCRVRPIRDHRAFRTAKRFDPGSGLVGFVSVSRVVIEEPLPT